jgi:PAP2 superfamily protein
MARYVSALILAAFCAALVSTGRANAQTSPSQVASRMTGDFENFADDVQLDLEDISTSPLYIASPNSILRSPRFYLELAGAGAVWGGSYALDQTMHARFRDLPNSAHDVMENFSYVCLISGVSLLYLYGLDRDQPKLRSYMLTGMEGAGMGVLFNLAVEAVFGRLRPVQSSSHTAFFRKVGNFNASSFTSEDMVITSAMATGISEYFDNAWYVAVPAYSLMLTEGFTRLKNQNWFSDVIGGALLGWATTEMLLYLHKRHQQEPDRWRIFPLSAPPGPASQTHASLALGLGINYSW